MKKLVVVLICVGVVCGLALVLFRNAPEESPKVTPKELPNELPKAVAPADVPKEVTPVAPVEVPKELPKEPVDNGSPDVSKELPKAEPVEMWKDETAVNFKQLGFENNLFTLDGKAYSGVAIKTDRQGRKRGRYEYADGKLNGMIREWYTNGVWSTRTQFVHGMRHGTNEYFNVDGSLLKRQIWQDDKLVASTEKHELDPPEPVPEQPAVP